MAPARTRPRARAPPIMPTPRIANRFSLSKGLTFRVGALAREALNYIDESGRLVLIEEGRLRAHGKGLVFHVDGNIRRREQIYLLADLLDAPVDRVGGAVEEIDQPLGHIGRGLLEVDDLLNAIAQAVDCPADILEGLNRATNTHMGLAHG